MFTTVAVYKTLMIVLAPILADFVLGVLISIRRGTFSLSVLPRTVATNIFPYIGGLLLLAFLSTYSEEMQYLYCLFMTLVTLKFSKEALYDKIKALFSK